MSDELKSAWEIALEKLEDQGDMGVGKLTDEQKQAIADIRRKYQARIAETEISTQSGIRKAVESGTHEEIEKLQQQQLQDKERLNREMEREVEKVRKSEG